MEFLALDLVLTSVCGTVLLIAVELGDFLRRAPAPHVALDIDAYAEAMLPAAPRTATVTRPAIDEQSESSLEQAA